MKHLACALASTLLLAAALPAAATDYVFPDTLPSGCSGSSGSYTCSSLSLGSGDTLTINTPRPATITVNGTLDTSNAQINAAGLASDLTLVVTGTLTVGYQALIMANVMAGSVVDSNGSVSFGGNLITGSGALGLGWASSVAGSIRSVSGAITLNGSNVVTGSITSDSGAISVGYTSTVGGNVGSAGAVAIGQSATVAGAVTSQAGAADIGYGASVNGDVATHAGALSLALSATTSACLRSVGSNSLTLNWAATTQGVCCGGTCGTACVTNSTGQAMPAACASPPWTAGQNYSFESWDSSGYYIRHAGFVGYISSIPSGSASATLNDATFVVRAGLHDASCWSFESVNYPGRYLRHQNFVLLLAASDGSMLYRQDTTFCLRTGLAGSAGVSLESINYPGYFIRHLADNTLGIAYSDGASNYAGRATFYVRSALNASSTLHHLQLQHASGSGLTCTPSTLSVVACQDSACSSLYTGGLSGSLAASGTGMAVNWPDGAAFTIASGSSSTTVRMQPASVGSVTVSSTGVSPAATSATGCTFGSSSDCSFSAADSGFALSVPDHVAELAQTISVTAVRKSDNSAACVPAFASTSKTLSFACSYANPATGSLPLRVAGSALNAAGSTSAACDGTGRAVALSFDASGTASTSLQYADVGQMTLSASYAGSSGSNDSGLAMSGSASFTTRPAGFTVAGVRCTSTASGDCASGLAAPGNNPAAVSASDAAFIAAGKSFTAAVTAINANAAATPNFGRETIPQGVLLTPALVLPSGGAAGTLSNATIDGSQFSSGTATVANLSYSEVGIITLTPGVAGGSYLGSGAVSGTTSGSIGRFVPAGFALSGASVTHRSTAACTPASAFSYLGESFQLSFTLTAENALGATTLNYTGSFAKLDPSVGSAWQLAGIDGATTFLTTGGTPRLAIGTASGAWNNGVASGVTLSAAALRGTTADGPFNAGFGIAPADSDGVTMAAHDIDTAPPAGNDHTRVATLPLRFGRLRLMNGMGSQDRALKLPMVAQYWDGTAFSDNTLDHCTRIPASAVNFGNYRKTLTPADTVVSGSAVTLAAGRGTLVLARPLAGHTGTVDVALSLGGTATDASCLQPWTPGTADAATAGAALSHLRGAWCASTYDRDPSARASFGLYRGADHLIYQRENY